MGKRVMQDKELEVIETLDIKKQESFETTLRVRQSSASEDEFREKNLKLDSIIDVSGKTLDFHVIEGERKPVTEFYFYKNELNLIPTEVGSFKSLKTLKFFSNEVNLFPANFGNLGDLECLQVKLTVPALNRLELSKLRNLRELELSRPPPKPSAFPLITEIAALKRLTRLSVCHFSIRYLPAEIGCLINLEHLDLSFNKMRSLPDEITSLKLLISLKVSNNKLLNLPPQLSHLQRLENLDISNNRLKSLDCLDLKAMHSLRLLNLQHNLLTGCQIPEWINCTVDGSLGCLFSDETSEMDFCEGAIQEFDGNELPKNPSGFAHSKHSMFARRIKGWKRWNKMRKKDQKERLKYHKKCKVEDAESCSSECVTCRISGCSDCSVITCSPDPLCDRLNDEDLVPENEINSNSLINPGNEDFASAKESFHECVCPSLCPDGICKLTRTEESVSNLTVHSLAVDVLHDGSSFHSSNCVFKSKRHNENELENPKPTKHPRPTSDAPWLSLQYNEKSFCGVADYLPDGFYDAGRDQPFMPLSRYAKCLNIKAREVILLDREQDEKLDAVLVCVQALLSQFKQMNRSIANQGESPNSMQIASLLAFFVSDHFGGSDKSRIIQRVRRSVSGSIKMRPFVCTCAAGLCNNAGNTQSVETENDVDFHDIFDKSIQSVKERHKSVVIPIGDLQFGICRHRALLMKYLCDRMEPRIPCELVRGYLDFSSHAWNVIVIKRGESLVRMIVDACHPHDIRDERDPEYYCRYIPLRRMNAQISGVNNSTIQCSFPSLSSCNKIATLVSTSLMHCFIGPLESAVKIRTIKLTGTSAPEVRNFEYRCLGEVRILNALKHPCIVEYYGHQISSEWSETVDGRSVRILKSAIFMEYIKGGSLKSHLEKLHANGKNSVSMDLALSIARDVAFALAELHSRHIIHRDLKSENILIDLKEKSEDGTPIVKICDFDWAVPLYPHLHSCCIAHVGVHPPDSCVGTPRWMAPEVLRSMNQRNGYGLEVDIWSFGCVLLELLTLRVPYSELPDSDFHKFLQVGERPKLTDELEALLINSDTTGSESEETCRFLCHLFYQCTEKNPVDRPSAENIHESIVKYRARTSAQD